MPPKGSRKSTHANAKPAFVPPANAIPQPLPPSVEEAYRRKCCQIKHRYNQIEESNDASRLRLHRLRRQIDKLRVERAFLLEQIAKRTSTNVEDSEGSPSPPPTPKDKPLRTKRGHRKPSMIPDTLDLSKPSGALLSQSMNMSPASESFSQSQLAHPVGGSLSGKANGIGSSSLKPPKKPGTAFEIYCRQMRPVLEEKAKEKEDEAEPVDIDADLARGWKDLPEKDQEEFQAQYEEDLKRYQKDKEEYAVRKVKEAKEERENAEAAEAADDNDVDADVEGEMDVEQDGDEQDRDQDMDNDPDADKDKDKSDVAQDEDVEMGDSDK